MKNFLKENFKELLLLLILIISVSIELPYYIEAPGGTINITKRVDSNYDKKNGSLNMLYVTEYKGNIVTVLLSKIIKTWDLYDISNQQVSNETSKDIYIRNKVMLDNSINNATYVAYKAAGKNIDIKARENIIIATTKDNNLMIGDIVLAIDDKEIEDIQTIKDYLDTVDSGKTVTVKVKRDNKEKEIPITLDEDKILGIMLITNYEYETEEELDIAFRSGEGGSSGGLILALAIYDKISDTDILKGRKIAGTGTIDIDGNVGEIDGIKYKIAGAVRNKMDVVLVSPYNYDEAVKVVKENHYKIDIVKVNTFDEAIEYLTK